jgi:uncharacterized protein YaiL (DUF2058 family)
MNSSLRDQLLAAGLVTEKQARQAAQEQQRQARKQHSNPPPGRAQSPQQRQGQNPQREGQPQRQGQQGHAPQSQGQALQGQAPQGQTPHGQSPQRQPAGPQTTPQVPSARLQAQQAQAAKIARDQELNRRREDKAQRKARMAQIEQIVEQHRLPRLETEDYYSFIDGKKIRRMSVDAQRREQLTKRELVIVRYKGHYAVVPADIAERIRERDANMVVPLVQPTQGSSEADDAYKDYVVPDDLMW